MDRLSLVVGFVAGLGYGRALDPAWVRRVRQQAARWFDPPDLTDEMKYERRKERAREIASQ